MSMLLPSERLSSLSFWVSKFIRPRALQSSSWVELALLPSPQRVTYERRSLMGVWVPHSGNECSVSRAAVGRATAPLTEGHYEHTARVWVPLILRNEFSALQSSVVELALLPSSRGSCEQAAPFWASEPLSFWRMSSPLQSSVIGRSRVGRASFAPLI